MKDPKVLLITGASRGIGKELGFRAAREGYSVAVNYRWSAEEAQSVVDGIAELSGTAISVQAASAPALRSTA